MNWEYNPSGKQIDVDFDEYMKGLYDKEKDGNIGPLSAF
jgi:hypothetical protein